MVKFFVEFFLDRKKQHRFRIRSRNGKIVVQSEGYKRKGSATKLMVNLVHAIQLRDYKVRE